MRFYKASTCELDQRRNAVVLACTLLAVVIGHVYAWHSANRSGTSTFVINPFDSNAHLCHAADPVNLRCDHQLVYDACDTVAFINRGIFYCSKSC